MLPRVGINCNVKPGLRSQGDGRLLTLNPDFVGCVAAAGGVPVLLPPLVENGRAREALIEKMVDSLDGLVLSGGNDMHPRAYGQELHPMTRLVDTERDVFDLALVRAAMDRDLPVLAVCAGMQLLNVALGGTLHQHLADLRGSKYPNLHPIHDAQETRESLHAIEIRSGTRLAGMIGTDRLLTNSRHHQGVDRVAAGLVISAVAEDGVIEGLESPDRRFLVGVQWHPEEHAAEERNRLLFRGLVDAGLERTEAPQAR